jgi:hypothetical protein
VAADAPNLTGPLSRARAALSTAGALLPQGEETVMRNWFSHSITMAAIAGAGNAVASMSITPALAQAPSASAAAPTAALKTPWGEPDLQGIWTAEFDVPLQRSAKYAGQEFFTEAQRAELDKERAMIVQRRRERRTGVGDADVSVGLSLNPVGARTSLIVDPPDGRIPSLTPEAQRAAATDREFRLALLQATEACKNKQPACNDAKYDPTPSPRRAEPPPRYIATNLPRINRYDGPEDGTLQDRCLTGGLPQLGPQLFGGTFRRIVQTPGGISMFYDVGMGHAWQRNIVMDGSPHLPANIRQWYGDSRGHWEGNTLVIDVTNFSPKTDFQGSRENLHLVERWTRTGPTTLDYEVGAEDPTVWTRPWTAKQELTKQNEQENRIFYEPRCAEGNYGIPGILRITRAQDLAFAEGRGPDPAGLSSLVGGGGAATPDPLQ